MASVLAENAELRRRLAALEQHDGSPAPAGGDAERARLEAEVASMRAALDRSETRYRLIVESAVDYAIIATDPGGVITTWNEAAEAIMGWSAEQMIGRSIAAIFTPEDVAANVHGREMHLSLTLGKARDERWHMRADGGRFFGNGEMMPLMDDAEKPIGFIKIVRDRTREHRSRQELEVSRERLQLALDASALVGTWDWDIASDIVYSDRRFARLYGVDPDLSDKGAPISSYVDGIHPGDRDRVAASIAHAVETADTFAEEYRTIDIDGRVHWIQARGRCFRDEAGKPVRFPGAVVEITREKARQVRQAALLRLGDELLRLEEPADHMLAALRILGETLGLRRVGHASVDAAETLATVVSEWTAEGSKPLAGSYALDAFGDGDFLSALRSGIVVIEDVAAHDLPDRVREVMAGLGIGALINMTVVEEGRLGTILYLHSAAPRSWSEEELAFVRDVLNRAWAYSRRRRAEQALLESQTRLRLAHEAAAIGTFDYDMRSGAIIWDERCRAAFGISTDAPISYEESFIGGIHPEDRERVLASIAEMLDPQREGTSDVVFRTIGREDGITRWIHANGQKIVEGGETVRFVGAVRDVTETKEAEERQRLLTGELQHRVKNTLAMVGALANQTLRRAANVQEGLAAFSARLVALGEAHDILTQTSWTSAPIGAIIERSLASHRPRDVARLSWSGADLRLTAKQGLGLALALHELATNAAKYGALSNDSGTVTIVWKLEGEDAAHRLHFEWRERGGPKVESPSVRGFGSRLIEQSLAQDFGGTVELRFETAGLVCTIDALLVQEEAEQPEGDGSGSGHLAG